MTNSTSNTVSTLSDEAAYLIDEYGDVARWFLESYRAEEWDELYIGSWVGVTKEDLAFEIVTGQEFEHPNKRKIDLGSCMAYDEQGSLIDTEASASYLFADDGPCVVREGGDGYTYVFWRKEANCRKSL